VNARPNRFPFRLASARASLFALLAVAVGAGGAMIQTQPARAQVAPEAPTPTRKDAPPPQTATPPGGLFAPIAAVLLSPRCMNCHPAGDAPLQGDRSTRHSMNVSRRSPHAGLPCSTCHRRGNADVPFAPPGIPGWHMPPDETPMVFEGRSPAALCRQLKDHTHNGGRSLDDLAEHMAHDPLVLWAWNPGPGRTLPPMPHPTFVAHVRAWVAAGGPCP
jgi:hypothetical protein